MNIEEISEQLISSACDLQGDSLQARNECKEVFIKNETDEQIHLRIGIDGMIATLSKMISEPINEQTEETSYQIGLSASFIRSYFLVTDHIMNGDLVEGIVLLRKQIETLARILELEQESATTLKNKIPNIKHVLVNGTGRIYGQLSKVAHFSTPDTSHLLGVNSDGDRCGPNLVPQFQESAYSYMDLSHFTGVRFAQWMLAKLKQWYPKKDFSFEHELAILVIFCALHTGVLETAEEPSA